MDNLAEGLVMTQIKRQNPWPMDYGKGFGVILVFLGMTDAIPVVFKLIGVVSDRFFKRQWAGFYLFVDLSLIIAGLAFIARHPRKVILTVGLAAFDILFVYVWVSIGP